MAIATTKVAEMAVDGQRVIVGQIVMDNSYPTGGEVVAPGDLGLQRITAAILNSNSGFVPVWDNANVKVKLFQQSAATSALTELTNTADASATTITGIFFGV